MRVGSCVLLAHIMLRQDRVAGAMAPWWDMLEALDIPEDMNKLTLEGKLLQFPKDKAARYFVGSPNDVLTRLRTLLPAADAGKPASCITT